MKKQTNPSTTVTKAQMNRVAKTIGEVLRIGVAISAAIMIFGLILFIVTGKTGYGKNFYLTSFSQLFVGVFQLKPYAIMMLGIFALILTPALRVIVSIYSFYVEHDKMYVIITSIVLIILIISFILGVAFHL